MSLLRGGTGVNPQSKTLPAAEVREAHTVRFTMMRKVLLIVVVAVVPALGFAPPSPRCVVVSSTTNPRAATNSQLWSTTTPTPEPLATEGDWSAYIDTDRTGYVYYFNGVTGESLWEPPTTTFPVVTAPESTKEERRAERQKRREQKKLLDPSAVTTVVETTSSTTNSEEKKGRGGLFSLFGGGSSSNTADATTNITPTTSSKKQQLLELGKIVNNDEFLNNVDAVIAEAQEAIAIAAKVNDKSSSSSSSSSTVIVDENNNIWVEGLKNLFKNTFDAFIPPPLTTATTTMSEEEEKKKATFFPGTTNEKKKKEIQVVATVETPNKEKKKANVSDSDFLDVIWGAETSARPTLNIVEMMKAFQIRSTESDTDVRAAPGTIAAVVAEAEKSTELFRTLTLDAALEVRAHPEKVSWGGEDAGFIAGRTFGVFDGVSGAAKIKGKKLYSRCLAETMKKSVGRSKTTSTSTSSSSSLGGGEKKVGGGGAGLSVREMTDYLIEAKKLADVEATGASTAVIASIGEDNILRALNIGDSVCLVLRNGAVAARTREIIHYFDCPYQLGDDSPDRPSDGTTLQAEIFGGDIIVAGSDGVFDNLSDADVCEIVNSFGPRTKSAMIAKKIVDRSRTVSLDTNSVTPYSTVARGKTGYAAYKNGRGGKVDDISCLVVKAS
jgi:protein phosphatase PTC7